MNCPICCIPWTVIPWDSELAVKNIENIVTRLGFDLFTKVLDWDEFRQLQLAYLKSSVLDLEALSDHAIFATLMEQASKNGIRYIINGSNMATEGILPLSWRYDEKLTDSTNMMYNDYKLLQHQTGSPGRKCP